MSCVLPATDCSEKSTTLGNSTCVSSSYVDCCTMLSNLGISNELKLLLFTVSIINTGKKQCQHCYMLYMYFYAIHHTCIFMLYVTHVFLCYMLYMYFYVIPNTHIFVYIFNLNFLLKSNI